MKKLVASAIILIVIQTISFSSQAQKMTVSPGGSWSGRLICQTNDSCKNSKIYCVVRKIAEPNTYRFLFYKGRDSLIPVWKSIDLYYDDQFQVATSYIEGEGEWKFLVNPTDMNGWLSHKKTMFTFQLVRSKSSR